MIGAACITATLNATPGLDLPYAFGGDGATVLIPPAARQAVADALIRTRRLAQRSFGLELRVGMVPVAELARRGRRVLVAKYQLSPGNHLAMFAGGGVELADRLIKDEAGFALEDAGAAGPPDLAGPVLPLGALSVAARPDADSARAPARGREPGLAAGDHRAPRRGSWRGRGGRPIQRANMRFVWPPRGLRAEALATRGRRFRSGCAGSASGCSPFCRGSPSASISRSAPTTRPPTGSSCSGTRTTARSPTRCTWCSTAPTRRSPRSRPISPGCTPAGKIVYGTHLADRAMMTCLVFSLEAEPARPLHRRRRRRLRARRPPAQGPAPGARRRTAIPAAG